MGADPSVPGRRRDVEDADAHMLRLCLDLQLDALLLTLGAAAAGRARDGEDTDVPWRRWVGEDVDLAWTLASDALSGRAALPPTLGSDLDHAVPATTIDNLTARYEQMRALLIDLAASAEREGTGEAWRPRLHDALDRCERRLAELREHRLLTTPPRGMPLAPDRQYLPGELLG
jgi:hypothetical protein